MQYDTICAQLADELSEHAEKIIGKYYSLPEGVGVVTVTPQRPHVFGHCCVIKL